ncbi:Maintenance of telomere capping protein 6 [Cladophialophora chaetospira]|uniref:Maintenance of telomere capping protein 6 n=1 Tax=Cladophialophora chaetospira TaxID=386627 RepID=A0AA39CGX8_9EURO|nr:Maintenance of telomere capping protein 6 [Cladophialophora chaetospira]
MSTLSYKPDPGAEPDDHWATVYLSMRDASAEIPINFITHPGVHVTQACFSERVYDDLPAQTCISDLFAGQFRRLIIDLYWDNINQQFNLCPVELPPLVGNNTAGYSVDSSALYSITASTTVPLSTSPQTTTTLSNATTSVDATLQKRQQSTASLTDASTSTNDTASASSSAEGSSSAPVNATSTVNSISTSTTDVAIPTATGATGGTLLRLGPYLCSLDLNIGSIISLYDDYIHSTSDTLSARLQFLDLNLHAAAPFTDPSAPAHTPMPARLPAADDLIGAQFRAQLDDSLFTPLALEVDRRNLNKTWFRDDYRVVTDTSYFRTIHTSQDGTMSTTDGWPGEAWALLTDSRRLLVSWGDIDHQMAQYDFRTDSFNIFNASDLIYTPPVEWDSGGSVTAGCLYHKGETTVTTTNASWAMGMIDNTNPSVLPSLAENMTACGLSPVLNTTIGDAAATHNLLPYQDFAQSAVYGWAQGEPANASSSTNNDDLRCAVLDSNSPYNGHWRVETCQKTRRAACRIAGQPFAWRLSTSNVPFGSAPDACPEHTAFGLPRTGLENTYLYQQILKDTSSDCDDDCKEIMSGVWINFNSLDQPNCWVIDGPNGTCPYSGFQEEQDKRNVLIPTIAAIIILILSVLTLLVKCNQNRRNRRTRRRGENGWEYEGIPS